MTDTQQGRPAGGADPATPPIGPLIEQIVEAALADTRVAATVSRAGVDALRTLLLAQPLAKPDEVVAAASHKEPTPETA